MSSSNETSHRADAVGTIVVGTDFSDTSDRAFDSAVGIGREHGGQVVIVHAVSFQELSNAMGGFYTLPDDVHERVTKAASERLQQLVARARSAGVDADSVLELGPPAERIVAVAEQRGAELISVGTRGHGVFRHPLLGSTAKHIVQLAACPVLTVHAGDDDPLVHPRRVLIPTDFSDDAALAAREVGRLFDTRASSTQIVLLHADHLPVLLRLLVRGADLDNIVFEDVRETLLEKLDRLAVPLREQGFAVSVVAEEGEPAALIGDYAAEHDVDLIAMGTRGRSGLPHVLLGSTAERVLQHARCPVLTVRGAYPRD